VLFHVIDTYICAERFSKMFLFSIWKIECLPNLVHNYPYVCSHFMHKIGSWLIIARLQPFDLSFSNRLIFLCDLELLYSCMINYRSTCPYCAETNVPVVNVMLLYYDGPALTLYVRLIWEQEGLLLIPLEETTWQLAVSPAITVSA